MLGYFTRPVALLMVTSIAVNAADLPANGPSAVPVPAAFTWTGPYVGFNVGNGWSSSWSSTANPLPSPAVAGINPMSFSDSASGIIGGGQIGYNWQLNPRWVLGFETDFQGADLNGGGSSIAPIPAFPTGSLANSAASMVRDLQWFGTARVRLGLTYDRWLIYGTGGFAYGQVNGCADSASAASSPTRLLPLGVLIAKTCFDAIGIILTLTIPGRRVGPSNFLFDGSTSGVRTGWTVGGGVEYALLPSTYGNWTIRAEYLFIGLGGDNITSSDVLLSSPAAMRYTWSSTNLQIVRVGVNYRF